MAWRCVSLTEEGMGGGAGLGTAVSCDHGSGLSGAALKGGTFLKMPCFSVNIEE